VDTTTRTQHQKTTAGFGYIRGRGIELEHNQQLSIMHRAFDSEDIIYSVLKYLKRKDLKNVAMTCSWLAGHALNILWSKRLSLVSVIMCLPHDTLEIKDDTIVGEVYHLNLDSMMLTIL
jgi:hypothetical protein